MKTWMIELMVVAAATFIAVSHYSTNGIEYVGWLAVLATFGHAQIAERLAEKQAKLLQPDVDCHRHLIFYYLVKEVCWLLYFIVMHSYAALCGCIIFILYPIWRKLYRKFYG